MSHNHSSSTSPNFQSNFNAALDTYKKCTAKDLLSHPLVPRFQACDSPSSILTVLQDQVQELNESQRSNMEWLDPTVNVLHAFSESLGGVGSVVSPATVIFVGFAVFFSAAKYSREIQDNLIMMSERMEAFFRRLDIYTAVAPNDEMVDTITAIQVEVLLILAFATKELKQGRFQKFLRTLAGYTNFGRLRNTDFEDALEGLDRLTQEEARNAAVQLRKVTDTIDNREGLQFPA